MTKFLTLKEVAELLRIGERTAYEMCRTGRMGGAVKVGGQWRINRDTFDAWVAQGGEASSEQDHRPEGAA